jgi:hypothetical protein
VLEAIQNQMLAGAGGGYNIGALCNPFAKGPFHNPTDSVLGGGKSVSAAANSTTFRANNSCAYLAGAKLQCMSHAPY